MSPFAPLTGGERRRLRADRGDVTGRGRGARQRHRHQHVGVGGGAVGSRASTCVARRTPRLGVGVHLALVGEDRPVLSAAEVPTSWTVEEDGWPLLADAGPPVGGRTGGRRGHRRELTAQLDLAASWGISSDHLDTHQHLHLWPSVGDMVLRPRRGRGIGSSGCLAPRARGRGGVGRPGGAWPAVGDHRAGTGTAGRSHRRGWTRRATGPRPAGRRRGGSRGGGPHPRPRRPPSSAAIPVPLPTPPASLPVGLPVVPGARGPLLARGPAGRGRRGVRARTVGGGQLTRNPAGTRYTVVVSFLDVRASS